MGVAFSSSSFFHFAAVFRCDGSRLPFPLFFLFFLFFCVCVCLLLFTLLAFSLFLSQALPLFFASHLFRARSPLPLFSPHRRSERPPFFFPLSAFPLNVCSHAGFPLLSLRVCTYTTYLHGRVTFFLLFLRRGRFSIGPLAFPFALFPLFGTGLFFFAAFFFFFRQYSRCNLFSFFFAPVPLPVLSVITPVQMALRAHGRVEVQTPLVGYLACRQRTKYAHFAGLRQKRFSLFRLTSSAGVLSHNQLAVNERQLLRHKRRCVSRL